MSRVIDECISEYSWTNEDTKDYGIGWTDIIHGPNGTYNNSASYYQYTEASEIDSWPYWAGHAVYSGGGYLIRLQGEESDMQAVVDDLVETGWIDRYTRAVFVEFTVYNPMTNLFGICTFVAEFLNSGGIDGYYRIEPMNLLGFFSNAMLFQLICQIVYLIFILVFIIKEIRKLVKQGKKYFKEPWNWVEMCIIGLSIGAVVIYFYRLIQAEQLTSIFEKSGGNAYMNFRYVGYWNEVLLYFVGWLVFLATVKFLRLLR